jgi:hypothetical protein
MWLPIAPLFRRRRAARFRSRRDNVRLFGGGLLCAVGGLLCYVAEIVLAERTLRDETQQGSSRSADGLSTANPAGMIRNRRDQIRKRIVQRRIHFRKCVGPVLVSTSLDQERIA